MGQSEQSIVHHLNDYIITMCILFHRHYRLCSGRGLGSDGRFEGHGVRAQRQPHVLHPRVHRPGRFSSAHRAGHLQGLHRVQLERATVGESEDTEEKGVESRASVMFISFGFTLRILLLRTKIRPTM